VPVAAANSRKAASPAWLFAAARRHHGDVFRRCDELGAVGRGIAHGLTERGDVRRHVVLGVDLDAGDFAARRHG
jgi:hypothetical protein